MALNEKAVTPEVNLLVNQGSTFTRAFSWGSDPVALKLIAGVTNGAPVVVQTAQTHGLPTGWPVWVEDVQGMRQVNNPFGDEDAPDNDPYTLTVVDTTHFSLDGVSGLSWPIYTGGGVVRTFPPVDMTGMTARMQIRQPKSSATVLLELTTENGGIVLDNTAKTITVVMTAAQTALLTFTEADWDLEMVNGATVTRILQGKVRLSPEVTR